MVNFVKRLSLRVKMLTAALLALLLILLLAILLRGEELTPAAALELTGIERSALPRAPVLGEDDAWTPAAAGDGFAEALSSDGYALSVHPATSQIELLDRLSGKRWLSNPSEEQLAEETVQGALLDNLKSPFVLTYVKTEGKDQTIRQLANVSTKGIAVSYRKSDDVLQANYDYADLGLSFAIQYELTERGLKVRLPADGAREEGGFAIFSIDLLPYFGAAATSEDGYLFVPDGPGGLIKFDVERVGLSRGYIHQVYGSELTNAGNWSRSGERRENIAYPVFGLKSGGDAYVAVLTRGGDAAVINAMPPGLKSSRYSVHSAHLFREEYLYLIGRGATPIRSVQKERLELDREVEYRFLRGEEADYVGMAASYRDYLEAEGRLGERLQPVENIPLYLKLMGGNYEEAFGGIRYAAATTFPQAAEIVGELRDRGVASMNVVYYGWQHEGDHDLFDRLPIEPALGGEEEAKRFIGKMDEYGFPVLFEDDFVWMNESESVLSGKNNGIRGIDGTVFLDEDWFIAKPERTVAMAYETIRGLKEIGVSGILYNYIGEMVFNDYKSGDVTTRAETAGIYRGLLDYTRDTLGMAGVYRGNDYAIGGAGFIAMLPNESSYDFMVDETVPFYPMALHGHVDYTFGDGNLRNNVEDEFLKAIEYGALPSFFLSYEDSRKLRYSPSSYLFSSQYAKWLDRIETEYEAFQQLAPVYGQRIADHAKLEEDRYETVYEDGTKVVVDYGDGMFHVQKGAKPSGR
ncbi:DUF5696 domain-containing protein [Paenibacillus soyae]|uniref:DUF5696 domain-containing protein n=1 Tax=Paenibacillus soyae TaxID=2969249 RepID=A0A9X2MRN2_9BACL|nr:DUF5696 domain-containing protein [Paenibacillus soyae]MCR2807043.1 DUF5696 domain-containing protein [Paenibacillus soyae]